MDVWMDGWIEHSGHAADDGEATRHRQWPTVVPAGLVLPRLVRRTGYGNDVIGQRVT